MRVEDSEMRVVVGGCDSSGEEDIKEMGGRRRVWRTLSKLQAPRDSQEAQSRVLALQLQMHKRPLNSFVC